MVNDVTKVISNDLKVNIVGLTIGVKDGIFDGKITLMVQDATHLDLLIKKMEDVSGVVDVIRLD